MRVPAALLIAAVLAPQDQDRAVFTCKEANYRVSYPLPWSATPAPNESFHLTITLNGNFIGVIGGETSATVDSIVDGIVSERKLKMDKFKPISREEIKVAGERAVRLTCDLVSQGIPMRFYAAVFTHQGIAYRIIGGHALGNREAFERDYAILLVSFAFLGERKEWLERFVGKPARTAMLGGLASFELNRPRWTENTFESEHEWEYLERANFAFIGAGAWISLRARETEGPAAAELEKLRHELAGRLRKATASRTTVKVRGQELPGLEIDGEYNEAKYYYLATVVQEEGIAIHAWMEGEEGQKEAVRGDWERFLDGFALEHPSKPKEPPAYAHASREASRAPDPALAAVLSKATRLGSGSYTVSALAPDGARAILAGEGPLVHLNLMSGKRETLPLEIARFARVAWSEDGERILTADGEEVCLLTLDTGEVRRLKIPADEAAFGSSADEILLCAPAGERRGYERVRVNRLEAVRLGDSSRHPRVEYPLSRISNPEISPDRKRLAFAANRDYPRTAPVGGHLYTAAADGGGVRQLSRGPEEISRIRWSPDGSAVYVIRRLSIGEEGAVGAGGASDLHRFSAGTGESVNLTRSGRIGDFWLFGGDVVLQTEGWELPASQRGLFRIPLEDLEKATASRPLPRVPDTKATARAIGERVRAALGNAPLKDLVPTAGTMEKAARAFSEAASERCGRTLDFSAESLDVLQEILSEIGFGTADEPALVLGLGAYYGETLRRTAGAEWKLRGSPFGDWAPGGARQGNPLVEPLFPFSDACARSLDSETVFLLGSDAVRQRDPGRKILLVHPPSHGAEAVKEATPRPYEEARKKLDAGEVKAALDLLVRELEARPRSRELAGEVISLCEAAGLHDDARDLTRRAVEAGNEVPQLLFRRGDEVRAKDPRAAIDLYRRAVQEPWQSAEALIKLGEAYAATGNRPVAESCWRRAHAHASGPQKAQIVRLFGLSVATRE